MDQHVARPTPTPPAVPRLCRGTPVHRPARLGAGYAAPFARLLGVLHSCYTIRHHAYAHIGRLESSRLCPRDRSRAELEPCPAHPVSPQHHYELIRAAGLVAPRQAFDAEGPAGGIERLALMANPARRLAETAGVGDRRPVVVDGAPPAGPEP